MHGPHATSPRRSQRALAIVGASVLAAGLLVAACGDDDDSPSGGATTNPEQAGGGDPGGQGQPESGTLVSGDGWRGVLLDARQDWMQLPDGSVVEEGVESFVPTEEDVERFEGALPDALPRAVNPSGDDVTADELRDYVRQYTGVASGGARQLVVAGICDEARFPGWEESWIEVADGGSCFWDATMDLATGEIGSFSFNGPG